MSKKPKSENLGLHLKYCIVIFLVLTCIVGGLALYNQKLAIAGLSNAGLLLSIVLAVIAILITLWDVAGQRNSIGKVEKSVDDLKVVTAGLEEIVSNALLTIEGKQNELSAVTKILVDKTEFLNSATTDSDQTYEELKNQLTIIQKGLNRSEYNKDGLPRDRNVRKILEQLNDNEYESSAMQEYRKTVKEFYDILNIDK